MICPSQDSVRVVCNSSCCLALFSTEGALTWYVYLIRGMVYLSPYYEHGEALLM